MREEERATIIVKINEKHLVIMRRSALADWEGCGR